MCYLCTVAPRLQHTLPSRKHQILHPNLHTQTVRQQVAEPFFSRISHSETPRSPHSSAAEKLTEGLGKVIPSRPVTFLQHSCSNLTGQLEKFSKAPGALLQLCWRKFTAPPGKSGSDVVAAARLSMKPSILNVDGRFLRFLCGCLRLVDASGSLAAVKELAAVAE